MEEVLILRAIKKSQGKDERKGLSTDFQGFNFQMITSRIIGFIGGTKYDFQGYLLDSFNVI